MTTITMYVIGCFNSAERQAEPRPGLPFGAVEATMLQAMSKLVYLNLGRKSYESALQIQRRLLDEVISGTDDRAYLLLLEHDPPVITLGRNAGSEHVLASPEQLARAGIEVCKSARGGDVTCHGPGQLVGYPIMRLARGGRTVRRYVHDLEEVLIRLLGKFSLKGRRPEGLTGVWVGGEKIAAIGVAVSRWVAWHGFALNVSTNLSHFDLIVPCGLDGCKVTSMEKLLAREVSIQEVKQSLVECMAEVFGFDIVREDESPPKCLAVAGTATNEITGEISSPFRRRLNGNAKARMLL